MIQQYFKPNHFLEDKNYEPQQIGGIVLTPQQLDWNITERADVIILGYSEYRSQIPHNDDVTDLDKIRDAFYKLYYWHHGTVIVDIGDLLLGESLADSRFAMNEVLYHLTIELNKKVIILGGAQDVLVQQYNAFKKAGRIIDCAVIDKLIDLKQEEEINNENYLYHILTSTPNFIRSFAAIAFQSYYANPSVVETLDRLSFDCYRLGRVRDEMNDMEPVLRNTHILSVDMNVMKNSEAPSIAGTGPNGLYGQEICELVQYAGLSENCKSISITGIHNIKNNDYQSFELIAQMLWYIIDGIYRGKEEASLDNRELFKEFHVQVDGHQIIFLKSLKTSRWWMQIDTGQFAPCSHQDYKLCSNNILPTRWLKAHSKLNY